MPSVNRLFSTPPRSAYREDGMATSRSKSPRKESVVAADAQLRRHLRALGLESVAAYQAWCRGHGFSEALNKGWTERQRERLAAEKAAAAAAANADVMRHVAALGLGSMDEYRAWCGHHGFSDALHKARAQRQQELRTSERLRSQTALAGARRHTRRPLETIQAIARGEIRAEELKSPEFCEIFAAFAEAKEHPGIPQALLALLLHTHRHARFFGAQPAIPHLGMGAGNTFVGGLLALARRRRDWRRPLEEWRPDSHNTRRQFTSLARHLLAEYHVPAFMDEAWFKGDTLIAREQQDWFLHIGRGQNIRTAELPVRLTKMMAHHFLQAPADHSIEAALRYGQIRGLGGDDALVRAVVATRLGEGFEHEEFWLSVLHFFVNNPLLDHVHVGPIVDYVHHRKFVPAEDEAPAEPEFSMKGRGVIPLLRRVEAWHDELARAARRPPRQWEPSGFGAFRTLETDGEEVLACWSVQEVLTSQELNEEGKAMRHCVASYGGSCARGQISVWSMQVEEYPTHIRRRVMTIAVNNARKSITQARGRCNRLPGAKDSTIRLNKAPTILKQWARQEGLTILKQY